MTDTAPAASETPAATTPTLAELRETLAVEQVVLDAIRDEIRAVEETRMVALRRANAAYSAAMTAAEARRTADLAPLAAMEAEQAEKVTQAEAAADAVELAELRRGLI